MSYIYKIINDINNKVYIGKTNKTIEERFKEHYRDSCKKRFEKRPLYSAINKYGIEHFSIELIEECSIKDASDREVYWIEYFRSFKNGYNATVGGDGKSYLDYDLVYKTYLETKSIKETANIVNCSIDSVSSILHNYNISKEEIINNARNNTTLKLGKPIAMIDKTTNKVLKVFPSAGEAGRFINKSNGHILQVCSGKRKSAYGYIWKYI